MREKKNHQLYLGCEQKRAEVGLRAEFVSQDFQIRPDKTQSPGRPSFARTNQYPAEKQRGALFLSGRNPVTQASRPGEPVSPRRVHVGQGLSNLPIPVARTKHRRLGDPIFVRATPVWLPPPPLALISSPLFEKRGMYSPCLVFIKFGGKVRTSLVI